MADVNVTVMVDGKAVFAAGAAGAPDGSACAVAALSLGLAHFQSMKIPAPNPASPAAAKPGDTSL
jgi:hypothetical protein